MSEGSYAFYVGVDWAATEHAIVVLDAARRPVAEGVVPHTGEGLTELARRLSQLGAAEPARVAVALETPHGPIVDALLEVGLHVFALNPKQLDRFRDRFTVAGAKDDRRDARVLADSVATDRAAFRRLLPEEPALVQLREFSRVDAELHEDARRLANQLRAQLHRFYVQPLALSPGADEPWLWALLDRAPTPAAAAQLTEPDVAALLQAHHIRRVTAAAVLAQLRQPPLPAAPGVVAAASAHVALLLPRLRLLHAQRRQCARHIDHLLADLQQAPPAADPREHRDVTILRSLPGVGRTVIATMLAEASRALAARDYHALRAHAGVAPVTKQSGPRRGVTMRRACNRRLRQAVYHWGRVSAQIDARSRDHYAALRQRGHSHGRAVRGVADRLLHVLVTMLRAGTLYDPTKRQPQHVGA
jgi:transposase